MLVSKSGVQEQRVLLDTNRSHTNLKCVKTSISLICFRTRVPTYSGQEGTILS